MRVSNRDQMMGVYMLKFSSLTAIALVMSVTAAYADGLSLKEAPASMSWGGTYFGGTLGYGWGSSETYYNNTQGQFYPDGDHPWTSNDPSGALAGVTVGYNYVLSNKWVAGVEADLSIADITGKDNMNWGDGHHWQTGWGSLATLRARVGYEYGPNLIYATAGLAAVQSSEYNIGDNADQSSDNSGWKWGMAYGLGVERQFSDRLSGKVEYMHVAMPDNQGQGENDGGYTYVNDLDLLRVGLNYKIH